MLHALSDRLHLVPPVPAARILVDPPVGSVGSEAAAGAGVGATVGASLEAVPVLGPVLHGAAVALGAIGGAIAGAARDTFHPTAAQAEAWLTMARIHPSLLFLDLDKSDDPDNASRLARYFRIVSGEVPIGTKGNNGQLHNPTNSHDCDNPYQCNEDPDEPLTSLANMQRLKQGFDTWVARGGGKVIHDLPRLAPAFHRHPDDARALLSLIRQHPDPFKDIATWDEIRLNIDQVQEQLRAMRAYAGEKGRDPQLEAIFGGDLTPLADPPLRGPHGGGGHAHAARYDRGARGRFGEWDRWSGLDDDLDIGDAAPVIVVCSPTSEENAPPVAAPPSCDSAQPVALPAPPPACVPAPSSAHASRHAPNLAKHPHASPWPLRLAVGGLVVAAVGGGAVWYRQRRRRRLGGH